VAVGGEVEAIGVSFGEALAAAPLTNTEAFLSLNPQPAKILAVLAPWA
jgi:hypothetical protein